MCEPHSMQAEASGWHTIPRPTECYPQTSWGKNDTAQILKLSQITAQLYRIPVVSIGLRPNPETGAGC